MIWVIEYNIEELKTKFRYVFYDFVNSNDVMLYWLKIKFGEFVDKNYSYIPIEIANY